MPRWQCPGPKTPSDPIADFPLALVVPAHDVPGNESLKYNGHRSYRIVGQDPVPVGFVGLSVSRRVHHHAKRLGIELVLEERLQVILSHRTQRDAWCDIGR